MSVQSQEWNIRPRATACLKTERNFEDGESFTSRLCHGENGYVREDYAQDAWTEDLKPDALSIWQSTFRMPPPKDEDPLKSETVEDTIRRFMGENNPEDIGVIFILAMQLERKRQLIPRDRQRRPDGTLLLVYEHKQTGETFIIPDPEWDLEEIVEVQREVALRLGWIEPEPEADGPEGEVEPSVVSEEAPEEDSDADDTSMDEDTPMDEDPQADDESEPRLSEVNDAR